MRVLLVYPNCDREVMAWGDMGAIAEPLALEYVAAACEQAGHDAMILDLRLHPEQLELMLFAYQPDVVGVTGYSMHVIRNLEVLARVTDKSVEYGVSVRAAQQVYARSHEVALAAR